MEQRQELLTVEHLTKSYDGKGKALHDVSLSLGRGEFVTVIGPSGAGKSTFLRCINRLIDASEGSIEFDGREITCMNKRQMREARRDIGMIFQHYNLVHRATAIENVLQGRLGYLSNFRGIFGLYSEEDKRSAFELLGKMGLAEFVYQRADQLSGGQQQRVGIARALVQDPLLMLCDEPIASLDPKSSRVTMEMLRWVSDELGVACLVNLHQVDYAIEYSDRIVALKGGASRCLTVRLTNWMRKPFPTSTARRTYTRVRMAWRERAQVRRARMREAHEWRALACLSPERLARVREVLAEHSRRPRARRGEEPAQKGKVQLR